ncbi:threonine synthase [Effusibacillus dendaii]|uniref:Threonine synthase n=1 Tax=Effusibacillus dendaii TaxID=2743772 RepID=A0A7I8DD98_9BACL|nr:threonine synthase [Effusibacillus dendaii]BCJ87252.1 threonine synthase [Effusibacillus dendaii]
MDLQFECSDCGKKYDPKTFVWRCECGGLLDLEAFKIEFPIENIQQRSATLWRYKEALPFDPEYNAWQSITMGEGFTPLIQFRAESPGVLLKLDYIMPTLSFKDRGAAVLIAKAQELGATKVAADSSGNAGTSIAAYANRAGMACDIYVPESTSAKKIKQISAHGAKVHTIPGSREDTAAAAKSAVEKGDVFYASHVYNPFFYQGTKTYAFEIWEQLGGNVPEVLVIPVGNGTLVLGAYYGCKELLSLGLINRMPRFLAVQAEGCAPLAHAFESEKEVAEPVVNTGTEAEGIAIADPPRSRQILAAIRDTNGVIVTAPEKSIQSARLELAKQGFFVEPTTAATYAGFIEYVNHCLSGKMSSKHEPLFKSNPFASDAEKVVIPLCGAGLKAD